jgi:hypothetical protein
VYLHVGVEKLSTVEPESWIFAKRLRDWEPLANTAVWKRVKKKDDKRNG